MSNDAFNSNGFFTISSDSDNIGDVQSIAIDKAEPGTIFMNFPDASLQGFNIAKDNTSFNLLKVLRHSSYSSLDSLTNFNVSFDTKQPFIKSNGARGNNQSRSIISFINQVTPDAISNLINQLNLTQITASNGQSNVDVLMQDLGGVDGTGGLLGTFPQEQLVGMLQNTLNDLNGQLGSVDKQINNFTTSQANGGITITDLTNRHNDLQEQINIYNTFELNTISLPKGLQVKIQNNFNNFKANFQTQFNAVYASLVQSGQISSATGRTQNNSSVNQSSGTASGPGLAVDPTNKALDAQTNLILAQNQISIFVSTSGTNLFGPHQPYDQIISILDVMRSEDAGVPFTSNITVKNNITTSTATGDNSTICSQLYSQFSVSDIKNMIKGLQNKIDTNNATTVQSLVSIKRIQSSAAFQFMSAFTGFNGINFLNIDTSNLDGFDFDGPLSGANVAQASIGNLSVSDIGGSFGQAVTDITGAISSQAKTLYSNTFGSMNTVNWDGVFSKVDPSLLAKCPSLSQIKSIMQNPDAVSSEQLTKTSQSIAHVAKNYSNQLTDLKNVTADSASAQEQITQLQNQLKTMNP